MFCLEDFCARSPMTKQDVMVLPIVTRGGLAHLRCTGFGSWPHRGRRSRFLLPRSGLERSDFVRWPHPEVFEIGADFRRGRAFTRLQDVRRGASHVAAADVVASQEPGGASSQAFDGRPLICALAQIFCL